MRSLDPPIGSHRVGDTCLPHSSLHLLATPSLHLLPPPHHHRLLVPTSQQSSSPLHHRLSSPRRTSSRLASPAGMAGASGEAGKGGGRGTTEAGGFLGLVLMAGVGGEEGIEGMQGMHPSPRPYLATVASPRLASSLTRLGLPADQRSPMSSDEPPVSHLDRAHFNRQARHLAAFSIQLHLLQGPPITRRQLDAASRLLTRRELCDVMNERAAAGLCGNPQCTRTVDVTLRIIFDSTAGSSKFCSRGCEERGRAAILCFPWEQRGGEGGWGECWSKDELTAIVTAVTTPDSDGACAGSDVAAASIGGSAGLAGSGSVVSGSAGSGPAASGSAASGLAVLGSAGPQCVSEDIRSGTGGEGRSDAGEVEAAALLLVRLQSAAAHLWTAGMAGASGEAGKGGGRGTTEAGGFLGLVLMAGVGGEEGIEGMQGMEGGEDGDEKWQSQGSAGLTGVEGKREGRRGQWNASTRAAPLEGTLPAPACNHPQELESRKLHGSVEFNRAFSGVTGAPRGSGTASSSASGGRATTSTEARRGLWPTERSWGSRQGLQAGSSGHVGSGAGSGPSANSHSTCGLHQVPREGSREASGCRGGMSAAFWEVLLWERGDEPRDANSRCAGGDGDDSTRCSAAVGEAARLEGKREGEGAEEQGRDETGEQGEEEAEEQCSGEEWRQGDDSTTFNQTRVPTTTSPLCSSAPTPNTRVSPTSPPLPHLPYHSTHEPKSIPAALPTAPTWQVSLRPALRTSPRYQQVRAGRPMGLPRSVSWADAQGKALTEELRFSTRAYSWHSERARVGAAARRV
ncbi:unnamed protein product [Closterium sp. Naga37s-1]|nr:unnamed protein product [Closterium sp. Naga37s-1]